PEAARTGNEGWQAWLHRRSRALLSSSRWKVDFSYLQVSAFQGQKHFHPVPGILTVTFGHSPHHGMECYTSYSTMFSRSRFVWASNEIAPHDRAVPAENFKFPLIGPWSREQGQDGNAESCLKPLTHTRENSSHFTRRVFASYRRVTCLHSCSFICVAPPRNALTHQSHSA
ncbi:unnamed protein product, partial [Scytosiphon promiscuus]